MAESDSASEGPRSNGENLTGSAATGSVGAGASVGPLGRQRKRHRSGGGKHSDSRGVSAGTGSVCKLFVRKAPCNFADPWRKHSQQSSTGTGFLLEGRWVVTNAHVVHRAVSVLVRPTTGNPVKYNARVVALGLPCDLAVLEVEENFWRGKESLKLSKELPKLDDNVTCIGFPVGGENISVTRGVVSRIDVNVDGLMRIQIDAAINPGNSGGPVLGAHGLVVGMACSHLKNASNIGYIIPSQVLEQFISCIETHEDLRVTSCYLGVSSLGIGRVQTLESPALCRRLGLPEGCHSGVRLCSVFPLGSSAGLMQENDVLLEIDGTEISQDATVPLRDNERIHFGHLITKHVAGRDSVKVKLWRESEALEVDVALRPDRWLVPRIDGYDAAAEYAIIGGLVFIPLSHPWAELKSHDKHWSSSRALIHHYWGEALDQEGRQVVVLSKVLAHPCNVGYHNLSNLILSRFAGQAMRNVAELARAVSRCEEEQLVFNFQRPHGDGGELVVLDRKEAIDAEPEILAQHLIAAPCMVRSDGKGEPRPLDSLQPNEPEAVPVSSS